MPLHQRGGFLARGDVAPASLATGELGGRLLLRSLRVAMLVVVARASLLPVGAQRQRDAAVRVDRERRDAGAAELEELGSSRQKQARRHW